MGDVDDLFAQELLQLQRLAKYLYHRYKSAFGWSDFTEDDLFSETVRRILEITKFAGADGTRVKVNGGQPVDSIFYRGVMKKVLLEGIKKARLNRQRELNEGEGDEREDRLETLEDHAPLPDETFKIEELRRFILEERKQFGNDDCFTEIIRKILYEGYNETKAIDETIREMGGKTAHARVTYFRWFSKIRLSIDKRYTKNRKGEDEANGRKR